MITNNSYYAAYLQRGNKNTGKAVDVTESLLTTMLQKAKEKNTPVISSAPKFLKNAGVTSRTESAFEIGEKEEYTKTTVSQEVKAQETAAQKESTIDTKGLNEFEGETVKANAGYIENEIITEEETVEEASCTDDIVVEEVCTNETLDETCITDNNFDNISNSLRETVGETAGYTSNVGFADITISEDVQIETENNTNGSVAEGVVESVAFDNGIEIDTEESKYDSFVEETVIADTITEETIAENEETDNTTGSSVETSLVVTDKHILPDTITNITDENVVNNLQKLGIYNAIMKLSTAKELSQEQLEQAAVTIHLIVNNLSNKQQALVVSHFFDVGVDIMKYVDNTFTAEQMFYVGSELKNAQHVGEIIKTSKYSIAQMREIQQSVHSNLDTSYITEKMAPSVICILRKAVMTGIDVTAIAQVADRLTAEQVDLLITMQYLGVDITEYLNDVENISTETIRNCLNSLYQAIDTAEYKLNTDCTAFER